MFQRPLRLNPLKPHQAYRVMQTHGWTPMPICAPFKSISPHQGCASSICILKTYYVSVPHHQAQVRWAPVPQQGKAARGRGSFHQVPHDQKVPLPGSMKLPRHLTERSHCIPKAKAGEAPRARQKVPSYPWEELRTLVYCWLTWNLHNSLEEKKNLKNKPYQEMEEGGHGTCCSMGLRSQSCKMSKF